MSAHFSPSSIANNPALWNAGSPNAHVLQSDWSCAIPTCDDQQIVDDVVTIRLRHLGALVTLLVRDRLQDAATTQESCIDEQADEIIYWKVADRAAASRVRPLFVSDAPHESRRLATMKDPLILRLSQALEVADRSDDGFAGVYADALRLAIVTRIVHIHERSAAPPVGSPTPEARGNPPRRGGGLIKWRLKRVTDFIDAHLGKRLTLTEMAAAAGLSRMHFAAQFRGATGLRAHEYLLKRRVDRAKALLLETREPVAQIALVVGFQTQAHFTTVFKRFVGETPHQWRCAEGAAGVGCAGRAR